jgi:hypothetical protein
MHSTKEVGVVSPQKTSVVVDAEIQLDPDSNHFDYGVLIVSLYEYDQRLADVAASLVESRQAEVSYTRGSEPFSVVYTLGSGSEKKEHKRYYLVAVINNRNGVRTHYGYKNGTEGFAKISEGSSEVKMLLRQIRRREPSVDEKMPNAAFNTVP